MAIPPSRSHVTMYRPPLDRRSSRFCGIFMFLAFFRRHAAPKQRPREWNYEVIGLENAVPGRSGDAWDDENGRAPLKDSPVSGLSCCREGRTPHTALHRHKSVSVAVSLPGLHRNSSVPRLLSHGCLHVCLPKENGDLRLCSWRLRTPGGSFDGSTKPSTRRGGLNRYARGLRFRRLRRLADFQRTFARMDEPFARTITASSAEITRVAAWSGPAMAAWPCSERTGVTGRRGPA